MRIEHLLKYLLLAGIFLIPFIPFIVSTELFFPFITGKNFAFRILVEILFGLWVFLALKDSTYRPTFSWIAVGVGGLLIVMAVADVFAENPFKAIWSNFERMEGLVGLLHLCLYFFIAGTVLNTKQLWWWFANTTVAASAIMVWYSVRQLSGDIVINQGGMRVDGTLGNATYLAIYLLVHIFITALLCALWRGNWWVRVVYGFIIVLQTVILFYTATRGAILGFVGGVLLTTLLITLFGREYPRMRKAAAVGILGVLVLVGVFIAVKDSQFVRESPVLARLSSISISEGGTRFTIWSMALEGFKERPILGWGHEGFNYVFNEHYRPELHNDEPWFDRAHNVFFDWLIAGGILGLAAYLFLFGAVLYYIWRRASRVHFSIIERSILTGLLAAYVFHNLFVFDNLISSIFFFSLLAYIYSETRSYRESSWYMQSVGSSVLRVVSPVVVLLMVGSVYFLNGAGLATATGIINALDSRSSPTLAARIASFEHALSYNGLGSQEAAEQANQLALLVHESNASIEEKQESFLVAEQALKRELERAPHDARLHLFLGSLYEQYGLPEPAEKEFKEALTYAPKKQRIMFQLGFNYLNRGMNKEALVVFKKAFDLAPEYRDSRIYYAAALVYAGNIEEARTLLSIFEEQYGAIASIAFENNLLIRAFIAQGQYRDALAVLDARAKLYQDNAAVQLSRAAVLVQLEDREAAIAAIERAVEIQPELKDQGEQYIEEIRAGRGGELLPL